MILRKPYALLIKYFKIIHIIMFVLFSYLVFAIRKIYIFFADYVKNDNFTYVEGMSLDYVSPVMIIMVILLLAMGISIFLLMRKKDKPVLFYKLLIVHCSVLLVSFIYFLVFFKSLDSTVYEPLRIVVNRDISLFIYLINFVYVGFTFIRGFGFDIKKFSFDKDKKELHFDETDREEYEVNINLSKEDFQTYLNKQKREFSYYLKENSLILTVILVIAVVSLALYFYFDIFVINKTYKENQDIKIGKIVYKVNNTYLSDVNKYGEVINPDYKFLVVDFNILNKGNSGYIDKQTFRAYDGKNYYYPSNVNCDMFNDLGDCYNNQELKSNENKKYITVYKIEKDAKDVVFEILKEKGDNYKYTKVKISPIEIEKKITNYKLNDTFTINNSSHQVVNYHIYDKTSYEYEECVNEKCRKYTKTVVPKIGNAVLVVEISDLSKLDDDFLDNYIGLKYDNTTISGKDVKLISRHDNLLYLDVPSVAKKDSVKTLIINMRKNEYDIILGVGANE